MTDRPTDEALRKLANEREKEFGRLLTRIWPRQIEGVASSQVRTRSVTALEDAVRGFLADAIDISTRTPRTSRAYALVDDEVASLLSKLEVRLSEHAFCASGGVVSAHAFRTEFQTVRARIEGRLASALSEHRSTPPPPNKGGRPGKWNWEGALTHLIGLANHPDGLPEGKGAQTRIVEVIADWFAANSEDGSAPAESEIKIRARLIMQELGR